MSDIKNVVYNALIDTERDNRPSGLRAEKECEFHIVSEKDLPCSACNGTGIISREIPMWEAVEIAQAAVNRQQMGVWQKGPFILLSGERVTKG
jgi:hypothetical protein